MKKCAKMTACGLVLGGLMAVTALTPAANAADVNVRVLLPDGQYLSVGDSPNNRWYNRPEYRQYGFNRTHYSARQHAYVAYDPHGNYYGHNDHGGGWHRGPGGDDHGGGDHDHGRDGRGDDRDRR